MIGKDLPKSNIRNNDFINVVFGRRATRFTNPDFKVDREEIVEIFSEMNACTPSAVNTQPYKFLVIDSDEGKKKINSIMRPPFDRDRTTSCSFAVVVFADHKWIEGFDELYQNDKVVILEADVKVDWLSRYRARLDLFLFLVHDHVARSDRILLDNVGPIHEDIARLDRPRGGAAARKACARRKKRVEPLPRIKRRGGITQHTRHLFPTPVFAPTRRALRLGALMDEKRHDK